VIRPGRREDAEPVARVHVRSWQVAYDHVFPRERLLGLSVERPAQYRLGDLGYDDVVLWVLDDNPRARRFYELGGWCLDGATRTGEHLGVQTVEIRHRKRLDARRTARTT
jgi:hypothetical protein